MLSALGGLALVLAGVLGFGVFHDSLALDLVRLAIGVTGVALARPRVIAFASLALWLTGLFAAGAWLSLHTADNWLHFVLAVALLGLAPLVGREDLADDLERDLGGSLPAEV